jgi:hypothetical protein
MSCPPDEQERKADHPLKRVNITLSPSPYFSGVTMEISVTPDLFIVVHTILAVNTTVKRRFIKEPASSSPLASRLSGGSCTNGGIYFISHGRVWRGSLPNAIDPRGLLAFGVAGLGLCFIAWLVGQSRLFPRALSYLGYVAAACLLSST